MHRPPRYFFDGFEAFAFFGAFAFGLRVSLVERSCPLAMILIPRRCWSSLCCRVGCDARIKARLYPLELIRPRTPRVRASFEAFAHLWI